MQLTGLAIGELGEMLWLGHRPQWVEQPALFWLGDGGMCCSIPVRFHVGYSCQEIRSQDQMENTDRRGAKLFTGLEQNIARNKRKSMSSSLIVTRALM